jgi:hypothetical protein
MNRTDAVATTGSKATVETGPPQAAPKPADPKPVEKPVAESTRAPVPMGNMGIMPRSLDEAWRLCNYVAASDIVPKDFRGRPHNVLIAMQHGLEVGVPWMQAVQGTAIINGRPGFYGDTFLAVIMASPSYVKHSEYFEVKGERREALTAEDWKRDDTCAVCSFWRRGQDEPKTRKFSVAQAKKANLLAKPGPWQEYPDRQLQMRARSWAGRDCFADVLKGIRTVDELHDSPELVDVTPPREVRRMSEQTRDLHSFMDRTQDLAAAARTADAAVADPITVGPSTVLQVEQVMWGFTITLADGSTFTALDAADALELEKAKGTTHRYTFACVKVDGGLQLQSFASAD